MSERTSERRRILKGAIAAFNLRHSTIPCTVRDISETGCRLKTMGSIALPDTFELIIELDALIVPCEVVWRTTNEAGVRFTGPAQPYTRTRSQVVTSYQPKTGGVSLRKRPS